MCLQSRPAPARDRWTCDICNVQTRDSPAYHRWFHHETKYNVYSCVECDHNDVIGTDFSSHLLKEHNIKITHFSLLDIFINDNVPLFARLSQCDKCKIRYVEEDQLHQHRPNCRGKPIPPAEMYVLDRGSEQSFRDRYNAKLSTFKIAHTATANVRPRQATAAAPQAMGFGPRRSRARGRQRRAHDVETRPGGLVNRQRGRQADDSKYDDDGDDIRNPYARPDVGSDYHDWVDSMREPSPATSESDSTSSGCTVREFPPTTTYPGNQTDEVAIGWKFEMQRVKMRPVMVGDVLPLKPDVPYLRTRLYFDKQLRPAFYILKSHIGDVTFLVNYHWSNTMRSAPLPDPRRGSHDAQYEVIIYDTTTRPCMLLLQGTLGDQLANGTWKIVDPRNDYEFGNVTVSGSAFYR